MAYPKIKIDVWAKLVKSTSCLEGFEVLMEINVDFCYFCVRREEALISLKMIFFLKMRFAGPMNPFLRSFSPPPLGFTRADF